MPLQRYGGAAYGGGQVPHAGTGLAAIAVPDFAATYYVSSRGALPAYGQGAFGGRRDVARPAAGLVAKPDPDAGTVTIPWWWAAATSVSVARIDSDGTRVPVRFAEGLVPVGPSRRNPSTNPTARDTLDGYTAGSNTALSRQDKVASAVERVSTAVRGTATAAGAVNVVVGVDPVAPAVATYGWSARTSALATGLGLVVTWYDGASTVIGTQTYSVSAAARAAAAAGATWLTVTIDSWPAGAAVGALTYQATGLPAGGWMGLTARIVELGTALRGPWFDGDSLGAAWAGTSGLSYSALGQINTLVDAEAPLDVDLVYELTSGALPGWVARSEAVRLDSRAMFAGRGDRWRSRRRGLLTHPGLARTIPIWIEDAPTISRDLEQASFSLPGRRRKVVVTAEQRGGDEGELTIVCETFEERDRILTMLDDGSPLLLRQPADYGYPPTWWLSFGKVDIEPHMRHATMPVRKLKAPFIEVDRPTVATRALVA